MWNACTLGKGAVPPSCLFINWLQGSQPPRRKPVSCRRNLSRVSFQSPGQPSPMVLLTHQGKERSPVCDVTALVTELNQPYSEVLASLGLPTGGPGHFQAGTRSHSFWLARVTTAPRATLGSMSRGDLPRQLSQEPAACWQDGGKSKGTKPGSAPGCGHMQSLPASDTHL